MNVFVCETDYIGSIIFCTQPYYIQINRKMFLISWYIFFITFNILQTYVHIHIPVFINFSTLLVVVCNASKIYFYLFILCT